MKKEYFTSYVERCRDCKLRKPGFDTDTWECTMYNEFCSDVKRCTALKPDTMSIIGKKPGRPSSKKVGEKRDYSAEVNKIRKRIDEGSKEFEEQVEKEAEEILKGAEKDLVSKEDIVSGIISPKVARGGRTGKDVSLTKGGRLYFSEKMTDKMGNPTKIAISIVKDEIFIIPNITLEGIKCYQMKDSAKRKNVFIQSKDAGIRITSTLGLQTDSSHTFTLTKYVKIKECTAFKLILVKEG